MIKIQTELSEKQMRLFNIVPANPDEGDIIEMPLEFLVMSENSLRKAFYSVLDGRYSMTDHEIDVWYTEDGEYALTDGYHRVAQALTLGKEYLDAKVEGVGYSSYWRIAPENERFEFQSNNEFKGLELFAEKDLIRDLRGELKARN